METAQTFYGTVIAATPEQLIIQDGSYTAVYLGVGLAYSGYSVVGGTVTGYQESYGATSVYNVSGLDVPATAVAYDVQNDEIQSLFSLALSGNDSIYGSPGNDTIEAFGGTNYVDGGGGVNTEAFSGDFSQYSISQTPQGLHVTGLGESDTLVSIQELQFADETIAAPCFVAGSRLTAEAGQVPVEELRVGQLVRTLDGSMEPVIWLGRRRVACLRHPTPQDVWPVRVRAHAFGEGEPTRDLWLSPDHAVFVEGNLIPVRYLINGATIVQEPIESVDYWHVELARHAVLFAEGLAAESYLDTGNRIAFANGGGTTQLHPDFALQVWASRACAPLVRGGPKLAAVRAKVLDRAEILGFRLTQESGLHLRVDGQRVWPSMRQTDRCRFRLPAAASSVRILSNAARPAELSVAASDNRLLGVMIRAISIYCPWEWHTVLLHEIPSGLGFHEIERDAERVWRWTSGDAELSLPTEAAKRGVILIDIDVCDAQPSWTAPPTVKVGFGAAR
jgi:hypothetical protein